MHICLLAVNDGALESAELETVSVLADGLLAAGNKVDVIAWGFSFEQTQSFQSRAEASVNFHFVQPDLSIVDLVRFRVATPASHRSFAIALAVWQELFRLSLVQHFDVVDALDAVTCAILPAFSGKFAVAVEVSPNLVMYQRPRSPFENVPFDRELLALLQRLAIVLADSVSVLDAETLRDLKTQMRLSDDKIIPLAQSPQFHSMVYERAVRRHKERRGAVPYLKPIEDLEGDAFTLIKSFDEMIYNFLYQNSWRFRFYHWSVMLKQDPTLLVSKISAHLAKTFLKITGAKARASNH